MRGDTVSLRDSLYSYTSRGHGVHEVPPDMLHDDIRPAIGEWFYEQRLKPEVYPLEGSASICDVSLGQPYAIEQGDAVYFEWVVQGGSFDTCTTCNSITIQWSDTASTRSVSVTPYNAYQAKGDAQMIEVEVVDSGVNIWTGQSGTWLDPGSWSLGRVPQPCDDVVVNSADESLTIDIAQGSFIEINSLSTTGEVEITLQAGAVLEVKE